MAEEKYRNLRTGKREKPRLMIIGHRAFTKDFDWFKLRKICDDNGILLVADICNSAHLILSQMMRSPFDACDIVTMSAHRTLGGQKAGIILSKKDERALHERVDFAVFPQMQGGPHNHRIASTAATMKYVNSDDFRAYAKKTVLNSRALQEGLMRNGLLLSYGGKSNTHVVYVDSLAERFMEKEVEIAF